MGSSAAVVAGLQRRLLLSWVGHVHDFRGEVGNSSDFLGHLFCSRNTIERPSKAPPKIWQRRPLDQRTNQTQEFLLLWAAASSDEKRSDLHVGDLAP
jgi:hypothetical protein